MEYERFAHAQAPVILKVTVLGSAANSMPVRIAVNRQYLDAVPFERISPQPARVETNADDLVFEFAGSPRPGPEMDQGVDQGMDQGMGQGMGQETKQEVSQGMQVSFEGSPERAGFPVARIGLAGAKASALSFRQLVYP